MAPFADDDQTADVQHFIDVGTTPIEIGQSAWADRLTWTVLTDPQGNEFCVLSPR